MRQYARGEVGDVIWILLEISHFLSSRKNSKIGYDLIKLKQITKWDGFNTVHSASDKAESYAKIFSILLQQMECN